MNVKHHISPRPPVEKNPAPAAIPILHSAFCNRQSSGMALVITLILLSLITFMTVTFLIISQRERGSVSTTSDATTARFAADAALERAKAQILGPILTLTNDQAYDVFVSTNFINRDGFVVLPYRTNWNVNYDFVNVIGHPPLDRFQMQTNIANLQNDARPPVYMRTNALFAGLELRFYLDLNRNGRFETNGWWPVLTGIAATPTYDLAGNLVRIVDYAPPNVLSNYFIGDPEWIGQLEHPDQLHSSTNRFTSRYAFFAIPISKTLDLNYIDNQAQAAGDRPVVNFEGYLRNEGVGSWELNLAAFFADLNTNQWNTPFSPYAYRRPLNPSFANSGVAFDDALAIKSFRYNQTRALLASIHALYGSAGDLAVGDANSVIDVYSDGDLQRTPMATNGTSISDNTFLPWAGADNTNHFFTTQDLWDPTKTSALFTNRLAASPQRSSYDRYTYYRLLSQMGTDSRAERGKINVNWVNVDAAGNIVPMLTTNFVRWGALQFFTNAADRLLQTYTTEWFKQNPTNYLATFYNIRPVEFYYGVNANGFPLMTNSPYGWGLTNIPFYGMTNQIPSFGVHNIPAYINGKKVYAASVQRLLQLTANIFDATTNRTDTSYPYLPSVFRPLYYKTNDLSGNVFIASFAEQTDTTGLDLPDVTFDDLTAGVITFNQNVIGMPWIIGAKKGFPNFNQLTFETSIGVTRKLRAVKPSPTEVVNEIDQIYELGMTNYVVVSGWNSYGKSFPRSLELRMTNDYRYVVTGTNGVTIASPPGSPYQFLLVNDSTINAGTWRPYTVTAPGQSLTNFVQRDGMLDNAVYDIATGPARFIYSTNTQFVSVKPGSDPMPKWVLVTTNRFKYALIDNSTPVHHVVDYVNLDMSSNVIDLTGAILASARCPVPTGPIIEEGDLWCTNPVTGSYSGANIQGVNMQLLASLGTIDSSSVWPDDGTKNDQITGFKDFFNNNNVGLTQETPYNPTFYTNAIVSWQANDPLVHYTLDDLRTIPEPTKLDPLVPINVNSRYAPWGGNPVNPNLADQYNLLIIDPLATNSMAWDFPTNVMPNVGWLGRVHRGTPWQTVYLKPQDPTVTAWASWSGHQDTNEAARTVPSQDRLLFDVFTTAINDNATRGQLSVNQTGLADWSAVLGGVDVLTNFMTDASLRNPRIPTAYGEWFIEPAGLYTAGNMTALARIWAGINAARASSNILNTATIFPDKLFAHEGDILATPELTIKSPYLNTSTAKQLQAGISDEAYERIPQQIMGLLTLKHEPRYVIYCFGQALRPADHSIVMSGQMFGLCTNYQVTGETVARAVVRIENAPRPGQPNQSPRAVLESFNILPPD